MPNNPIFDEHPIDFGDVHSSEQIIKETWSAFRRALKNKEFSYNEISKALDTTFLKVFNQIFEYCHNRFEYPLEEVQSNNFLKRGARLKETDVVCHDRFLPKARFIKEDNRFSPAGVEWLYLAVSTNAGLAEECTIKECRAVAGDRFGICSFAIKEAYKNKKIVDLTVADELTYNDINSKLEQAYCSLRDERFARSLIQGRPAGATLVEQRSVINAILDWSLSTYIKLLSEQIFLPLEDTDNKELLYAPFQCVAQYFLSKGYAGIKYKSTVCTGAKDIVLFDKTIAAPVGTIKDFTI